MIIQPLIHSDKYHLCGDHIADLKLLDVRQYKLRLNFNLPWLNETAIRIQKFFVIFKTVNRKLFSGSATHTYVFVHTKRILMHIAICIYSL